jgi:hypothetical protein
MQEGGVSVGDVETGDPNVNIDPANRNVCVRGLSVLKFDHASFDYELLFCISM